MQLPPQNVKSVQEGEFGNIRIPNIFFFFYKTVCMHDITKSDRNQYSINNLQQKSNLFNKMFAYIQKNKQTFILAANISKGRKCFSHSGQNKCFFLRLLRQPNIFIPFSKCFYPLFSQRESLFFSPIILWKILKMYLDRENILKMLSLCVNRILAKFQKD